MREEFLQEEERSGYMIPASMKAVWAVQIELFQEFHRVCRKHGLRCWFAAGSLLGAIRNKGFIPWDDDIDLFMLREDYERLKEVAASEFSEPYFLQHHDVEADYFRGHAQFRHGETTAILPDDLGQGFNQGIFLDVFILDGFHQERWEKVRARCNRIRDRLSRRYRGRFVPGMVTPNVRFLDAIVHFLFHSPLSKARELEAAYRDMCPDSEEISFKWLWDRSPVFRREWFDETVMVDFEHIQVPVPAGYHEVLTVHFGKDYMTPQQMPTMHGGFTVLDASSGYREHLARLGHKRPFDRFVRK